MTIEEKFAEESKRDRCASPLWKWQAIQAAITFAEENTPVEFRRNRPRWHPGSVETPLPSDSAASSTQPPTP